MENHEYSREKLISQLETIIDDIKMYEEKSLGDVSEIRQPNDKKIHLSTLLYKIDLLKDMVDMYAKKVQEELDKYPRNQK